MELSQFAEQIDGNSLCFVSPREGAKRVRLGRNSRIMEPAQFAEQKNGSASCKPPSNALAAIKSAMGKRCLLKSRTDFSGFIVRIAEFLRDFLWMLIIWKMICRRWHTRVQTKDKDRSMYLK